MIFNRELKQKLLDGRTISYVANKVGISKQSLCNILNGKSKTTKTTAYCIVKECDIDNEICYYFKREGN